MSDPYVVTTRDGTCAGCGERLRWFHGRRWAHRRCAATLRRHRQPFVTKDRPAVSWSTDLLEVARAWARKVEKTP